MEKTDKLLITCECDGHILQVISDVEIFDDDTRCYNEKVRFRQDYHLSFFTNGYYGEKDGLWKRIKFCWYYLFGGKMYDDQIILSPGEMLKLENFIEETYIQGEND